MNFRIFKAGFGIAILAILPGLAAAEGFSSGYVTGFTSETECMNVARSTMDQHFRLYEVEPDTGEASFSVFGFDVPPGATMVAIVCSEDNGRVTATTTGYSLEEDGSRLATIERFLDYLEGEPVALPAPEVPATPSK